MKDKDCFDVWFFFVCIVLMALLLTGCAHNAVQYSDAIGFETVLRPDTGNFGVTFRYGKVLSVAARENTEVEMTGEGQGGGNYADTKAGTASSSGNIKIKIGRQVTGYYVDALKAGSTPEDIKKYINGNEK